MKTVDRILEVVRNRELNISVNDKGQPILRGPTARADPVLMNAIRAFRADIIKRLGLEDKATAPAPPPENRPMPEAPESWLQILDTGGKCIDAVTRGESWRDEGIAWRVAGYLHWHPIPGKESVFPGKDGLR